jgi:hypothetical protein
MTEEQRGAARERGRRYRERHRERRRETSRKAARKYYASMTDKQRERRRETSRKANRAYSMRHRVWWRRIKPRALVEARNREQSRRYWVRHRDRKLASMSRYRKKHKDRIRLARAARRARDPDRFRDQEARAVARRKSKNPHFVDLYVERARLMRDVKQAQRRAHK